VLLLFKFKNFWGYFIWRKKSQILPLELL
jgi:hypothetical protein